MTINTKFDVKDKVYVLQANKVQELVITRIDATISSGVFTEDVLLHYYVGTTVYEEHKLFTTKEELLASL